MEKQDNSESQSPMQRSPINSEISRSDTPAPGRFGVESDKRRSATLDDTAYFYTNQMTTQQAIIENIRERGHSYVDVSKDQDPNNINDSGERKRATD